MHPQSPKRRRIKPHQQPKGKVLHLNKKGVDILKQGKFFALIRNRAGYGSDHAYYTVLNKITGAHRHYNKEYAARQVYKACRSIAYDVTMPAWVFDAVQYITKGGHYVYERDRIKSKRAR